MIRLAEALGALAVYFLAALALGTIIVCVHVWLAWKVTPQRVTQALDVIRGRSPVAAVNTSLPEPAEPAEEPSYDAILQRRALAYRDLELKSLALQNLQDQLRVEETRFDEQQKLLAKREESFQEKVKAIQDESVTAGRETVRRTLESIKPTQAKLLLLDMLNKGEEQEVVALLAEMNDSKRSKIIAEFRTPEETDKIAEVLRLLREGGEMAEIAGANAPAP
ncbi:hypothetical protein [Thermopirellula anaerolimosa]